jgi:hypothetical protein
MANARKPNEDEEQLTRDDDVVGKAADEDEEFEDLDEVDETDGEDESEDIDEDM